jgi:lipopolysaccharide transport system ATP-binding protein
MSRSIIEVENVSKRYRLGQFNATTLREEVEQFFQRFRKKGNGSTGVLHPRSNSSEFWALKDVSFSVQRGEVIGIIGHNGAGKSTLLKILSRVTEPTSGEVRIRGRVASLLEVGTGFHPDLTGRENIFLNGAILGMSKDEIKQKFDEIVAFAEIDKFLDTPVKRYSSGMYVRLAFAVAAHLEPEILIVDEVLAVGDVGFQKKCLGRMSEVSEQGRTVLFVSHDIGAISTLTRSAMWIHNGRIVQLGPTQGVISAYLSRVRDATEWQAPKLNNNPIQILQAEISSVGSPVGVRDGFKISIRYVVREPVRGAVVSVIIHALDGTPIVSTEDVDMNTDLLERRVPGIYRTEVSIPSDLLSASRYLLRLHSGIVNRVIFDNVEALIFELTETGNPKLRSHKQAFILPYWKWDYELTGPASSLSSPANMI